MIRGDNDNGMKFTSFYAPRELRKLIQQKNSDGTKDYAQSDLNLVNNAEEGSTKHSPIIGWKHMMEIQFMDHMDMTGKTVVSLAQCGSCTS